MRCHEERVMGRNRRKNASDSNLRWNRRLEQLLVTRGLPALEPLGLRVNFDRQRRAPPAQSAKVVNANPDPFRILFLHEPRCAELALCTLGVRDEQVDVTEGTCSLRVAYRRLGSLQQENRSFAGAAHPFEERRRRQCGHASAVVLVPQRGGSTRATTLEHVRRDGAEPVRRKPGDVIEVRLHKIVDCRPEVCGTSGFRLTRP
jgi:hypothetical protein